jgi:acid phosphatase type 7
VTDPSPTDGTEPARPPEPAETAEPAEPTPPAEATGPQKPAASGDRLSRQVALGFVAFIATGLILIGLSAVIRGAGGSEPGPTVETGSNGSVASPGVGASDHGASGEPSASGSGSASSSASPVPSGDPILIGAGDIADCSRDADAATAALLVDQPGTVFTAGDNAYPAGSAGQFADCYGPTWGRELARTRPVPGNHDHLSAGLDGYLGYFGDAAAPDGTAWYSYDLGAWHVVALDSSCALAGGCTPESPQGRWLAADLAASDALCTLAIWHHPRFSSGDHGNDPIVAPLWEALDAAGADLVVNGHDHDYERFAPQNPDGVGDPDRGIREFVVGTGGAAIRRFTQDAANSQLRVALTHGVIKLTLRSGMYQWSWVPTSGLVSDSGSQLCH